MHVVPSNPRLPETDTIEAVGGVLRYPSFLQIEWHGKETRKAQKVARYDNSTHGGTRCFKLSLDVFGGSVNWLRS